MKFRRYLLLAAGATLAVSALPALAQSSTAVSNGSQDRAVNARTFDVRLARGTGTQLTPTMKRYANQPTLDLHWSN